MDGRVQSNPPRHGISISGQRSTALPRSRSGRRGKVDRQIQSECMCKASPLEVLALFVSPARESIVRCEMQSYERECKRFWPALLSLLLMFAGFGCASNTVTGTEDPVKEFNERVQNYTQLQKKAISSVPALPADVSDPALIVKHEQQIAESIRMLRPTAMPGCVGTARRSRSTGPMAANSFCRNGTKCCRRSPGSTAHLLTTASQCR